MSPNGNHRSVTANAYFCTGILSKIQLAGDPFLRVFVEDPPMMVGLGGMTQWRAVFIPGFDWSIVSWSGMGALCKFLKYIC